MEVIREINFEEIKEKYAKEIEDIIFYDITRNQKENFKYLSHTARVMCDTLHLLTKKEAMELKAMVTEAKKRI